MMICGACERALPEGAYCGEQRGLRQNIRRCNECVGNQLVLMKRGRARPEEDECPICSLLLPLDPDQSSFRICCMKLVCNGCELAARKRGMRNCPFCRTPTPDSSQVVALHQKRVDAGDPVAMWELGNGYLYGQDGLKKNVTRAVELYERAAELGEKKAQYRLGCMYDKGKGVEKDTAKAIRYYEAAAMSGDVLARFNLGCVESNAGGNYDLVLEHFLIAAKMGHEQSVNNVKVMFMKGLATKDDYSEALRGYQGAIGEMRSPDRDEALALGFDKIISM